MEATSSTTSLSVTREKKNVVDDERNTMRHAGNGNSVW